MEMKTRKSTLRASPPHTLIHTCVYYFVFGFFRTARCTRAFAILLLFSISNVNDVVVEHFVCECVMHGAK